MQKSFDLATMISIISGKLFTSWENLNSALNFLTGESLYTHQIPRAANVASKHILKSYPELEDIGKDVIINSDYEREAFVGSLVKIFGNEFILEPIKEDEYEHKNPLIEAVEMLSRE